jgi:hypothetical protein
MNKRQQSSEPDESETRERGAEQAEGAGEGEAAGAAGPESGETAAGQPETAFSAVSPLSRAQLEHLRAKLRHRFH